MAFWSTANITDPKRNHRWLFELGSTNADTNDFSANIAYICKKTSRPSIEINAVSVTLVDPSDPDSSANLHKLIQHSGYVLPTNITDTVGDGGAQAGTTSKFRATQAIGNTARIRMIDGDGNDVEVITLQNPWISKVDFGGDLAYDSDDLMEITLDIRFDWFLMTSALGGDTNILA